MSEIIKSALAVAEKLMAEGNLDECEILLKKVLDVEEHPDTYRILGLVYLRQKKIQKAIEFIKKAIELNPQNSEYYDNLAQCYSIVKDWDAAINTIKLAISIDPKSKYYTNLGTCYAGKCDVETALKTFFTALELSDSAENLFHIGNMYVRLKNLEEAEKYIKLAIEKEPVPQNYTSLGNIYFLKGEWEKGWRYAEQRLNEFKPAIYFNKLYGPNLWTGEPLDGKKLAIHSEQGLGDFINFLRYIPQLEPRLNCKIAVQLSKDIKALIEENFDWELSTEKIAEYDYHCSIMSLPCYLNSPIPPSPYLKHNRVGNFENYKDYFKIGISWAGNPLHPNDIHRSCPLSCFKAIENLPNVKLFSLQKDTRPRAYDPEGKTTVDLAANCEDMRVVNLAEYISDCSDTAAFMNGLDLIITVDTSVLHLAGALGIPTFGLIHYNPDWRWTLEGEKTVWYSSVRLFRQEKFDDWPGVFQRVAEAIKKLQSSCLT